MYKFLPDPACVLRTVRQQIYDGSRENFDRQYMRDLVVDAAKFGTVRPPAVAAEGWLNGGKLQTQIPHIGGTDHIHSVINPISIQKELCILLKQRSELPVLL